MSPQGCTGCHLSPELGRFCVTTWGSGESRMLPSGQAAPLRQAPLFSFEGKEEQSSPLTCLCRGLPSPHRDAAGQPRFSVPPPPFTAALHGSPALRCVESTWSFVLTLDTHSPITSQG